MKTGYRVEWVIAITGHYAPYTAKKRPVTLEEAESYARHLDRNQCGGRIVDADGKEIRSWTGKHPLRKV